MQKKVSLAAARPTFGHLQEVSQHSTYLLPHRGVEAVAYSGTFYLTLYQTHRLECLEVLRYGGLRQADVLYQVATYAAIGRYQMLKYGNASRVPECLSVAGEVELVGRIEIGFDGTHIGRGSFYRKDTIKGRKVLELVMSTSVLILTIAGEH